MKVISITGGVGSGKSEVLKHLEKEYNVLVLLADEIAHQIMEPGQVGYESVIKLLGNNFLALDGRIDRSKLAACIFKDEKARQAVNSIIHPLVWERIRRLVKDTDRQLVFVEAAVFEGQPQDLFDEIWYIYASKETRIQRLMEGRGYSREKCLDIMKSQAGEEEFKEHCDYIIHNDGPMRETGKEIKERLKRITVTCD